MPMYDPKLFFTIKNSQNFLRKKNAEEFAASYNVALVFRLVITLFCGSFNNFEKKNIFGVKNRKIMYQKYAFLVQVSF